MFIEDIKEWAIKRGEDAYNLEVLNEMSRHLLQ